MRVWTVTLPGLGKLTVDSEELHFVSLNLSTCRGAGALVATVPRSLQSAVMSVVSSAL